MARSGIDTKMDLATFDIVPKESTLMAGRGPTSFLLFFDEMAHILATGANRSAEEVYQASVPALDQFGTDGFIYSGSSPWQMTGQLYDNYLQALAVDPITKDPLRPEMLMVQLPSWALYEDYQYAHQLPMVPGDHKQRFSFCRRGALPQHGPQPSSRPGKVFFEKVKRTGDDIAISAVKVSEYAGKTFQPIRKAIQEYDEQMRRLERANPDTFRVERLSQWAASLNAYLDPKHIEEMFSEWPLNSGERLQQQTSGVLGLNYVAHGDPSVSGANFGWAMAHRAGPDVNGMYHVVFDQIHAWHPSDYPGSRIDYADIEADIIARAKAFVPSDISFDQFNSVAMIQRIQRALDQANLPKRVTVSERTATASVNWRMAETFKSAINMGLVHMPYHELLELELRFLTLKTANRVDHPTSGPVKTKDVADSAINVVYTLIGEQQGAFLKADLSSLPLGASQVGGLSGTPSMGRDQDVFDALRSSARSPRRMK